VCIYIKEEKPEMKKNFRIMTLASAAVLALGATSMLSSCGGTFEGVMIWGPIEHQAVYEKAVADFKVDHPEFTAEVQYGSQGDAGAYANLAVDPQSGASLYTFPNDQLINIKRIGAIAKLSDENVTWVKENHVAASVEAGKIGDNYYAYPISADNGFVFTYNKDAFRDTSVWDSTTDGLKAGYTFRDLYKALDERGAQTGHEKRANGLALWASGSAWYEAGVFFATGGDYSVVYDEKGKQTSASCTFGYKTVEGVEDYTIGLEATRCMINSFTNEDGTISKHFMYSEDTNPAYNDLVDKYSVADSEKPLAGIVTRNNPVLRTNWGDDYAVAVLPTLESATTTLGGTGNKYTWKTFSGFKLLGVNPYTPYAQKSEENLKMLHELAKYLSGKEVSLERYDSTSLGPSNLEAQEDPTVAADKYLVALNEQYNLLDGKGARVQDSTPSNFWTPIATFGNGLYNAISTGASGQFDNETNVKRTLKSLQADIESATK
jgi:arabinogalactan oligomer/maltooligosaccharide transport system substrate-binding protein